MRYDAEFYFLGYEQGAYDPATGDYADGVTTREKAYGSVTNTGTNMLSLLYGTLSQQSLTIRSQTFSNAARIELGGKVYKVDFRRQLRRGTSYTVSEVQ